VLIYQLFYNLINNSLKFTKKDTPPVISIESSIFFQADTKIEKIMIRDNGIGFEQQYADKIFDLFQRLHSRFDYEGTGIGLSICKKIVDNHHGIIYAEGDEDKGSRFTLILPETH